MKHTGGLVVMNLKRSLVECRVRRVVLLLDADDAGRAAAIEMAQRLAAVNIEARSVELPVKDAAGFITGGGLVDELRSLITESAASASADASAVRAATMLAGALVQLETSHDGAMLFASDGREYRVRGLSPVGLERLRVNVRLSVTDQSTVGNEQSAMTRFIWTRSISIRRERS